MCLLPGRNRKIGAGREEIVLPLVRLLNFSERNDICLSETLTALLRCLVVSKHQNGEINLMLIYDIPRRNLHFIEIYHKKLSISQSSFRC